MRTEQGFYLAELFRLVFAAAPVALILIGLTFQRRKQAIPIMLWLQIAAGSWLALSVGNHLLEAWYRGIFDANKDHSIERMQTFIRIAGVTGNLEMLSFLLFAILFLVYCRRSVSSTGPAANPHL